MGKEKRRFYDGPTSKDSVMVISTFNSLVHFWFVTWQARECMEAVLKLVERVRNYNGKFSRPEKEAYSISLVEDFDS